MDEGHVIRLGVYIGLMVVAAAVCAVAVCRNRRVIRCQQRRIDDQDGEIADLHQEVRSLQCKARLLMTPATVATLAPVVPLAAYKRQDDDFTPPEAVPLQRG